jgi:hypothetical protein
MYERILTDEQVLEIHRRVSNGETHLSVAKSIGISRTIVTGIARGKIYKRFNLKPTKKREFLADKNSTIEEKFRSGYTKNMETGCWEWNKATAFHGYGVINWKGKIIRVHRLSYELANGPIPDGMQVLHECDNPCCCNPDHLRLGTVADNMMDVKNRLRGTIGEKARHAKLTTEGVVEIMKMIDSGIDIGLISEKFDVTRKSIVNVQSGHTWRHVTGIRKDQKCS